MHALHAPETASRELCRMHVVTPSHLSAVMLTPAIGRQNVPKALGYAGITVTLEDIGNELGEDVHPSSAISLAQFETLASKVSKYAVILDSTKAQYQQPYIF